MISRRRGRIIAFQALYFWDMVNPSLDNLLKLEWVDEPRSEREREEVLLFPRLIITGTLENLELIDANIKKQLEHWDFNRLSRVDLAILRISVYSLLYQLDIPSTVTIDEAIDIAKTFGTDESYRFVNGVLDGIRKAHVS